MWLLFNKTFILVRLRIKDYICDIIAVDLAGFVAAHRLRLYALQVHPLMFIWLISQFL